jgi:hypothetical protein
MKAQRCLLGHLCLAVVATATASTSPTRADDQATPPIAPDRHGFTIELGLGVSFTGVSATRTTNPNVVLVVGAEESSLAKDGFAQVGLAPLSIGVGWFVTRDVALTARITSTSFFPIAQSSNGGFVQVVNSSFGVAAQYWLSDSFFLGAGVGLGRYGTNPFLQSPDTFSMTGIALLARAGYALDLGEHRAWSLVLELTPSVYHQDQSVGPIALWHQDTNIIGSALLLEWQHY